MRRIILLVWTLPAIADVVDTYASTVLHGGAPHFARTVLLIAPGWYAWAAMTPAILWLSNRWPLRPVRATAISVHVAASVVAVALHVGVIWATGRIFDPGEHVVSGRTH